jgi:hypothetical protein
MTARSRSSASDDRWLRPDRRCRKAVTRWHFAFVSPWTPGRVYVTLSGGVTADVTRPTRGSAHVATCVRDRRSRRHGGVRRCSREPRRVPFRWSQRCRWLLRPGGQPLSRSHGAPR